MHRRMSAGPAKIAIFRALYLGDFICATPALIALRNRFPHAELTLIGLPWTADILDRFGIVDRFEPFPGFPGLSEVPYDRARTDRFLERMRAEQFDLAIQLHGDGRYSNRFVVALGAAESIGYRASTGSAQSLGHALDWQETESEVRRWLRLTKLVDASASEQVQFPISPTEMAAASDLLGDLPARRPVIGLHCGSKLPSRRWPIERFAELGRELIRAAGTSLVATGAEGERSLVRQLRAQLDGPLLDLTGKTTIGTLAAVVDRLDLLVTNDTGVSHLAAARGTPSVVLFGPSDPRRWAPLDRERHRVVDGATESARTETSMTGIPVARVLSEGLDMLDRWRFDRRPGHEAELLAASHAGGR